MTITVFTARTIVTMASTQPSAEAVAIENGRIVAVGSYAHVQAAIGDLPHVIDDMFADRVILPGLIDQHLHPILGATTLATEVIATEDWVLPDRTYPAANTHDEYVAALRSADRRTQAESAGDDDWLFTWGYHQLWHGELSRQVLDSVSTIRPIGVWQRSCHEFYLNTAGLKALGILDGGWSNGIDPAILATANVESGHFWERGFFNLLFRQLTPILFSPERLTHGLHQMVRYLHQNGVTAFNEPGAILVPGAWELYQEILGADDTPFFSYFLTDGRGPAEQRMDHESTLARAAREYAMAPDCSDRTDRIAFFPRQVKLFADGAIISQLMQMRDPYLDRDGNPDPDHHGEWIMPPDMFEERSKLYWDAGFQIHVHVNGDLGLDMVLDMVERRLAETPRNDHRTVIVHFANSTEEQVDRIAALGCIVSSNPYYPVGFADKFGEVGLGPQRADLLTRNRSVVKRGVPLSFHSDLPMGRSDPIGMVSCAVNRITQSGRVAAPEQRLSIEQALRAVTIDAAHSWRKEDELGSIEVGKIANFTVVDQNPLDAAPIRLDEIEVLGTVFRGEWFAVPDVVRKRVAAAASRGPGALQLIAGSDMHDEYGGAGCICDVARAVVCAIA
ncbi:amidohydrolase [uncultured Ilumatobacter sp.]|uniref:amidohydrolase n=1 Tax=uncultured Ilumatobacter sp. TaxID=879968 RepID=UPI00374EFF33